MAEVYEIKFGDTLFELARRFGVPHAVLASWNNLKVEDKIIAGRKLTVSEPAPIQPPSEEVMTDKTPTAEDSQHAADHIEDVMDEMDAAFTEIKAAAAAVKANLRAETKEMAANMKLFDTRVVGRMRTANSRFRNFITGNGAPPLDDDVKVIEHKPE